MSSHIRVSDDCFTGAVPLTRRRTATSPVAATSIPTKVIATTEAEVDALSGASSVDLRDLFFDFVPFDFLFIDLPPLEDGCVGAPVTIMSGHEKSNGVAVMGKTGGH
jgi:hypothetical protein